ncbi:hypothetical protein [Neptunomonas sp.]|uniref:hypothetical protein n=1 Tax=Neptunomonas sp. TaxID=1971898 RepID=UPI0025D0AA13|nr:hypothetical protein [Neptunomonas sp.]
MKKEMIGLREVRLIRDGIQAGLSVESIADDPSSVKNFTDIDIDKKLIEGIKSIDKSVLAERAANLSNGALEALNSIILDGRYISSWKEDIPSTLTELGIASNPETINELEQLEISDLIDLEGEQAVLRIGLITVVVVVYAGVRIANGHEGGIPPVLDFSQIEKF